MGFEIVVPIISALAAGMLGLTGVALSNRSSANRASIERLAARDKELDLERMTTRETIVVLSNNVEHIVTELRSISEEFRLDHDRTLQWQMKVETRIGTIEGRVERCEKQHKVAAAQST